ncbi:MAG: outer membrane beta-barrel protein [Chitinivibrionales bacterium]|nr:outer membrane beta-barrel protein [Chitinivibrionales bacterium]
MNRGIRYMTGAVIMCALQIFAADFNFLLKLGSSCSWITGKDENSIYYSSFDEKAQLNPEFGVAFNARYFDYLSFQIECGYERLGEQYLLRGEKRSVLAASDQSKISFSFHYLEVPVILKAHLRSPDYTLQPNVYAGAATGFLLKSDFSINPYATSRLSQSEDPDHTAAITEGSPRRVDLAFLAGAGLDYPGDYLTIGLDLRYGASLLPFYKSHVNAHNQSLAAPDVRHMYVSLSMSLVLWSNWFY